MVLSDISSEEDGGSEVDFKISAIVKDDEPEEICCPISFEIFRDPVRAADGHTYERKYIEKWFKTHDTSPWTGLELDDKSLKKDTQMRRRVKSFRELRNRFAWQ